jgi:excisionase family DNA binding protein
MHKSFPDSSGTQLTHVSQTWGNQQLFTLKQAAHYAICTPRYLQTQIRAGRLKALKPTGKLVRIRRSDLDSFLESGATIGGDAL